MVCIVGYGPPVLLPNGTEARQFRLEILADLDGSRNQHRAETRGIVDKQLRARVTAEDSVLHPAPRGRDIEPLTVPVEPVRAQMRAPVEADPSNDDIARLGQECLYLVD